jgi:hypothetical protein
MDQLVGLCVAVFVGAIALYGAVLLIQAVWVWLVAGATIVAIAITARWLLRMRYGRW